MADASNVQTSFLGGEFSPYAQGRFDDPDYKAGMNVCRNIYPVETGAAVRRSGTKQLCFTRKGQKGRLLDFQFTGSTPYTMEFTDGVLRFLSQQQQLVLAEEPRTVTYINEASPAVLVTSAPCSGRTAWSDGDTVLFNFLRPDTSAACGNLTGKQFTIKAGSDQQHWLLFDALTGLPVDGSTIQWAPTMAIQVGRVFEISTPYVNGLWAGLRATQTEDMVILWHPTLPPYAVFAPIDGGNLFTLNKVAFKDGPYLNPPTDGSYLTTSGVSGVINLVLSYPAWDATVTYKNGTNFSNNTQTRGPNNTTQVQYAAGTVVSSGGNYYVSIADGNLNHAPPNATYWKPISINTFMSTDVGRLIRLYAEPAQWAAGTAYTTNQLVTYQGAYYTALQNSTGKVPGTDATNWGVASNAAAWTWGIITSAADGAVSCSVSIQGDPLLYNQNILTYRLGVFSDTTGYPSCGTFHEGRLWTGGVVKNRFDAGTTTGDIFNFAPTSPDGTVSDSNGISYLLKSKRRNKLLWMTPAMDDILCGTAQSEWLIKSSNNNDPITPTSIQAHEHTSLGSNNADVVRCGTTIAFVQRYGNQVIEYLADLYSGKPVGKNLATRAKHLTAPGIIRLGYQQELVPILWALTSDGKLLGTTYKRESLMSMQPPTFNAWHHHDLGSGFKILDMVVGAAPPCGKYETATLLTQDPVTGYCRIEALAQMFGETSPITDSWFVDCGAIPKGGMTATVNGVDGVQIGGLGALEGKLVSAFIAGLDLGDYTVTNGTIFVPYQSDPDKLFTLAYVQGLSGTYEYGFRLSIPRGALAETIMQLPVTTDVSRWSYLNFGSQAIADWKNDRVTFMLPGTGPTAGFLQFKISTGAFIQYVTSAQVFGSPNPAYYDNTKIYSANPKVVGSDGSIYTAQVSSSYGVDPTSAGQADWVKNTSAGNPTVVPSAYAGGTTYAAGAFVTSGGNIYKSLQNANVGNNPATSPTWWQLYYPAPSNWSATTQYGAFNAVTGSNDHIYWPLGDVPAGQGDPTTFSTNANPYWQTAGAVWPVGQITTSGLCLDFNGDIWMYNSGVSVGTTYVKIDGNTLKMKGAANVAAGLTVPSPANYATPLRILDDAGNPLRDYMVETVNTTPSGTNTPSAVVMSVNGMRINGASTISFDEGANPTACGGTQQTGFAQAYVLTRNVAGNPSTPSVGLYEIDITLPGQVSIPCLTPLNYWRDPNITPELLYGSSQPITKRKINTISPSTIDSTWTFFAGFSALMFDPNDGNVIFFVSTANPSGYNAGTTYNTGNTTTSYAVGSDGKVYRTLVDGNIGHDPTTDGGVHWALVGPQAAVTYYLVKFTTDYGRLVWRTPVTAAPAAGDNAFPYINLSTGYFVWLESLGLGNFQWRQIDTLTGQSTILYAGQAGVTQLGDAQVFNSDTGDVFTYVTYNHGGAGTSAPPVPVNPTGGVTANNFTGWSRMNITVPKNISIPGAVGFTFTSQGQLLRPVSPQESGARNGPAFGKTRRNHRYAIAVANAAGLKVGSDLSETLRPVKFKSNSGKGALLLSGAILYTGEHSDTVEGDYDLNGMLCWQSTRPLPATVTALGGFLQTQDR